MGISLDSAGAPKTLDPSLSLVVHRPPTTPRCVAWLADHANRLRRVCQQDNPVEEAGEDVKQPL